VNLDDLKGLVVDGTVEAVKDFALGEVEDVRGYASAIAADAIRAAKEGKPEIMEECKAQAKLLAEMTRLSSNRFAWDLIAKVLFSLAKVAVKLLELKG
jgi:hypothetical protein